MATVRTLSQLLALYADNDIGAISAGDGRDEIASCFGFFSSLRAPGPLDDNVGTGGSGAFFDTGSKWLNLVTGQVWECFDGAPSAAVWRGQAYDGEPMGGRLTGQLPVPVLTATGVVPGTYGGPTRVPSFHVMADGTLDAAADYPFTTGTDVFVARLSTGPLSATVLTTTLSATVAVSDSQIFLANPGDYRKLGPAMAVPANGGFSVGCRTTRVNVSANSVESDTPATGNYSGPFTFTPDGYEWFEQQFDPDTGEPSDKVGGRSGTITTAPAIEINGAFAAQNDQVFMSLREVTASMIPVYQFSASVLKPDGETNSIEVGFVTVTDNISETTITHDTITTNQATVVTVGVTQSIQFTPQGSPPPYSDSLWVDASGDLEYNDSSGNPQKLSTGSVWHKFVVKYSDFPVSVGGTINLMSMGPYDVVSGCIWYISQTWVGSFTSTGLFFGYQDGNNPVSDHNTSAYGGQNVTLGGAPQTTLTLQSVFFGFNGQSQPGGVSWHLTATLGSAGGGTFTAGEVVVWFKVDSLPQ